MTKILPILYNTGSSYYSMIARLVFAEKHLLYINKNVDIHIKLEQYSSEYVKLNPYLTIPTLVANNQIITSSKNILYFVDQLAASPALQPNDSEQLHIMTEFIELHYQISIENFTFGKGLQKIPFLKTTALKAFKKQLQIIQTNASRFPELKEAYLAKEKIVQHRLQEFSDENIKVTYDEAKASIVAYLNKMDQQLAQTKWLAGDSYSLADIVSTCLLARIFFIKESELIKQTKHVLNYYQKVYDRPSFKTADIWTSMHVSMLLKMIWTKLMSLTQQ